MVADVARYAGLVLEGPLENEKEAAHYLVLTAYDGGRPSQGLHSKKHTHIHTLWLLTQITMCQFIASLFIQ